MESSSRNPTVESNAAVRTTRWRRRTVVARRTAGAAGAGCRLGWPSCWWRGRIRVYLLVADTRARVIDAEPGQLLRELTASLLDKRSGGRHQSRTAKIANVRSGLVS
jgi:hypothetical protein